MALVANRAINPCSKRAALDWAAHDVLLPGIEDLGTDPQVAYRAMGALLVHDAAIQESVFFAVAGRPGLECDVLLLDTTSTYFETEDDDDFRRYDNSKDHRDDFRRYGNSKDHRDDFRRYGNSKDHRPDRPQAVIGMAVIGMAVTKEGIPVRAWSWPGNTADSSVMKQVHRDLSAWGQHPVLWVGDRGFASAENRRLLQSGGGHMLFGEKLRGVTANAEALARPGRFATVTGDARLAAEAKLDGTFLLSCTDDNLPAADAARLFKGPLDVERGFRDLKSVLEVRPVYHRKQDRINAHVTLCFLALVLVHVAENHTGLTWPSIARELNRIHAVDLAGSAGTVRQRTEITPDTQAILDACTVPTPPLHSGWDAAERAYLTVERAWAVQAALRAGYRLLFMFLILTGLRWAEAARFFSHEFVYHVQLECAGYPNGRMLMPGVQVQGDRAHGLHRRKPGPNRQCSSPIHRLGHLWPHERTACSTAVLGRPRRRRSRSCLELPRGP